MAIDFQREFGVNAAYAEAIYQQWLEDAAAVAPSWRKFFEAIGRKREAGEREAVEAAPETEAVEPLRGVAGRIARNMEASLEVPTATTVRTLPMKVLDENRRILNAHMKVRALGKASFTHLFAFAMVRALKEMPVLQARFELRAQQAVKVVPQAIQLGLAIDLETSQGRNLVVPNVRDAGPLDFKEFHARYEELVTRARAGSLASEDFRGTTVSLTNPGGFGTGMSVPRLMKGQGLIVAMGALGVPVEAHGMAPMTLAGLALGPVMTVTATYDHRVIQGAQSGLFLKRIEELLQGEAGFYEEIFRVMRVPWQPVLPACDLGAGEPDAGEKQAKVWSLISAYRARGCRLADLDPLQYRPDLLPSLDPGWYGFTIWDLDREFLTGGMCGKKTMTLREILEVLRESYCRRWTIESMHITDRIPKHWIRDRIESHRNDDVFGHAHRVRILTRLYRAQNLERFLHTRFVGNKRFSLEGAEALIPALAELIDRAAEEGVRRIVLGMAHRGRLNVLANILKKSYDQIFGEFEGVLLPVATEGSGDVKYHLGQKGVYQTPAGREVEVILSANPSHLEAVDPVVCGMVRAFQDKDGDAVRRRTLGVLIHGDAAFCGQGVVAEALNMSELPGYTCGGTFHLIVNNQIGFTAGPRDLRSTFYCSDLAKGIEAPILHANGDNPEAVLRAVQTAFDYQWKFGKDVIVDMVCYRRWGHNEGDEPAFTQPVLYQRIRAHPTVVENYQELLVRRKALSREECAVIGERFDGELKEALAAHRKKAGVAEEARPEIKGTGGDPRDLASAGRAHTGVPGKRLVAIIERCNRMPEGHTTHPNLLRQLRRREDMVGGKRGIDWGCAEALAFGSLLEEGVSIRLAGQDSGRGTFSQRHAVIRDQVNEKDYIPLAKLAAQGATFEVRDSFLSEEAALAFEYGYASARPEALVLWEAQFGDFANGAQVPIDQFLASSESKWGQRCGLTLLLPHGYDGQGPEHSSARMERFLALCAEGNLTLCHPSTSAQYFHLLRDQGLRKEKRPLVILTPKSSLRDPRAASPAGALEEGSFLPLLGALPGESVPVATVLLCSGKIAHEFEDFRAASGHEDVVILRLEQLYPFPAAELAAWAERFTLSKWVWCQEEPRNMGAWIWLSERFRSLGLPALEYAGRPASASPATGSYRRHQAEQKRLVEDVFAASARGR
ncbi:MAG: multifunctional oxoglutarate decarboxylase/oxoglutarate dehydrogenase thiamine pyrophosphate-binding subunit/dihydrolipoyllysine-residue succinyltransferase subunit [Planctomycetota bacterium]